jgi:ATP phosphoribosyltransferase regulatory subunit HisZ
MRSLLGILALAFALALPAAAQQGRWASTTPEQRAEKLTEVMKDKLALTADQVPKVKAINLESAGKIQALHDGSGERAEKMKAAHKIQSDKESALKQVLTPDQYKKYEGLRTEFQEKAKERMKEHMRDKAAAPAAP